MRDGFVPINIKFIDRADYYTAFNEFNQSAKTKTMENIIGKALTNSLVCSIVSKYRYLIYHKNTLPLQGVFVI
jgi:hypothetical protein